MCLLGSLKRRDEQNARNQEKQEYTGRQSPHPLVDYAKKMINTIFLK